MSLRAERKYLLEVERLGRLRRRLDPFVEPDPAGRTRAGIRQYTVRSIYFDTPVFDALTEKVEGLERKRKLRVRGYGDREDGDLVFLEVKERVGEGIRKRRAPTRREDLSYTLERGERRSVGDDDSPESNEAASAFFFHLKSSGCRPVSLIVYEREAFSARFEPDVRVTIDRNVRGRLFPEIEDLYSEAFLSPVWPGSVMLEVKHSRSEMPSWLKSLVQELGLHRESLSKYASAFRDDDVVSRYLRI